MFERSRYTVKGQRSQGDATFSSYSVILVNNERPYQQNFITVRIIQYYIIQYSVIIYNNFGLMRISSVGNVVCNGVSRSLGHMQMK